VRTPDVVLDDLRFPEGLRWRDGRLVFADMLDRKVLAADLRGGVETVLVLDDDRPSGLGQHPDGRWLVVAMEHRQVLTLDRDGTTSVHADLAALAPGHLNDMVVDASGRAYVGVMAESAPVLLVRPDGTTAEAASGLAGPNGAVVTPDGATLIFAETRASRLVAWSIADDGTLRDQRTWADLGEHTPDGICLDAEGAVWVGAYRQQRFIRVLEGGRIADEVDAGRGWALTCALGGEQGRTLLCACAVTTAEDWQRGRSEGWIAAVDVDVPGAPNCP
jgi:sugar lactone lactonase YvrE